jgi:two-component system, OmpR family, phosphate regulon response regulator PhoB
MARVLVVEDERDLQKILEYNLRQAGHVVLTAGGGRDGLSLARGQNPDLLLLDLMLPDIPGTEVCRALRSDPGTHAMAIMMLTAKGEEIDRVVGLELGADDYVTKPFSMRELLLRIEAVLRRARTSSADDLAIQFGHLRVDREAYRVWVDEQELDLTALEFKLLVALHDRRDRVQTRSVLLDDVWGIEADITTRTVDTHVKRLREKLGPAGDYIETVRGVGYRFANAPEDDAGATELLTEESRGRYATGL